MTKILTLAAAAALMTGISAPAQAAFYFEGLVPFQDAPNCNDPYATTCGRYGQVPHYDGKSGKTPHAHPHAHPHVHEDKMVPHHHHPRKPGPRLDTRKGLDK